MEVIVKLSSHIKKFKTSKIAQRYDFFVYRLKFKIFGWKPSKPNIYPLREARDKLFKKFPDPNVIQYPKRNAR